MKFKEIVEVLEAEVIVECENTDLELFHACGSDLMSDVMAFVKENVILITGLMNAQVIRTAEIMDIKVVAFVRGKSPDSCMVDLAKEKGITIIKTKLPMFLACGKLYHAGIRGRGADT